MPYATEADYRATILAYRALHDVFYRFHHSVSAQQADPSAADGHHGLAAIAVDEQDFGGMVRDLLPALARSYAGPSQYLDRLVETFDELGAMHAASRKTPFDPHVTHQAYIDVDNILQDLLREREHYPSVFDDAFAGAADTTGAAAKR